MCVTYIFIAVPEMYKTVDPKTEVLIVNFVYHNNTKQVKTQWIKKKKRIIKYKKVFLLLKADGNT